MIIAPASSIGEIYPFFTAAGEKRWVHVQGDKYGTGYGHGSDTVDNLGWDLFKDAVKLKAREL